MDSSVFPARLLVVDDDENFLSAIAEMGRLNGWGVETASTLNEARVRLRLGRYDLVILDLGLPDGNGLDLLQNEALPSSLEVAIVTGNPTVESAVYALHHSVRDYLLKPLDRLTFEALLKRVRPRFLNSAAPHETGSEANCGMMLGASAAMSEVFNQIYRVAPLDVTVFIHGESGTGKELAAQALHEFSKRTGPFIAVNCGAVTAELLASQLFGHEKGSFTGAIKQHTGYFEQANSGTLLLDEITEMPLTLQAHLLRVLETRNIMRVGGIQEYPVDVRVLAATNRAPRLAVSEGYLREDLYYRLMDFPLSMPPLRDRAEDILLLAQKFLDSLNTRYQTQKYFAADTEKKLIAYSWPGNIRELKHTVQRAYILSEEMVSIDLSTTHCLSPLMNVENPITFHIGMTFDEIEKEILIKTLLHFNNDKAKAAEALGISLKTIYNRLARFSSTAELNTEFSF